MLRFLRTLPCVVMLAAPVFAQNGDRAGEEQAPLPAHIVVPPAPVLTPEQEAATFKLAPGFRAELVAADPLLGDPVAMQFGPDGRLWVVEMRGYMPNPAAEGETDPVGVIAVLTDTDGDGRYDKRSVFADGLAMPRALALVGDGVLVAAPPQLWFMRDTDGDGKADARTEVANDYADLRNPEHNANGLMWAMDNWIYSANYTGRFRYLGDGKFQREATVTRGQWGISQDDTGRIFYNSNSDPLRHDPIPSAYLKRHAGFQAAGTNVAVVPSNLRIWPGRVTPGVNRGYRILDETGRITSMTAASGPVVYRGTLFPAEFRGDAFVPEPSANLIKRIKVQEKDGVVVGANAYDGTEFMTSTDERFRPVNLYNGPDGALYVVDFYRGLIQHRIYLTSFLRQQVEARGLAEGRGRGRIWRIVPEGAPRAKFDAGLAKQAPAALVARLAAADGWVRDTAQRLLVERKDAAAVAPLRALALAAGQPALARVQALWTLDGFGGEALDRATVLAALGDADARVAAAAVRVGERFLKTPADAGVLERVIALAARPEPALRLQLALTLGETREAKADTALAALVAAAGAQPFFTDAVVSGLAGREAAFIAGLAARAAAGATVGDVIATATAAALRTGQAARIDAVLSLVAAETMPAWARTAVVAGVKQFLPRSSDGKALKAFLPVEPKALVALAAGTGPDAAAVRPMLEQLKWPGKVGQGDPVRPLTAAETALFEQGKTQFAALCAACHQPNGQGLAGLAPSLVYSKWVLGDDRLLARIVLNGKVQENLVMPPWKAALDDQQIAAVLTFVRRSWGHEEDPVTPATVATARTATASRAEPFTDADLEDAARQLRRGRGPRPGGGGPGGAPGGEAGMRRAEAGNAETLKR
jgi:glucose/arabinose dehydrogenase/mono/diheme cytochrome c family protein